MSRIQTTRTAPPFSQKDIVKMQEYFLSKGLYRNYVLFEIGINTGLTNKELLGLKYSDFLTKSFSKKDVLCIDTKPHQFCPIAINDHLYRIVMESYKRRVPHIELDSFIFVGEGHRKSNDGSHLTEQLASREIRRAVAAIGLSDKYKMSSMRSTFLAEYWGIKDRTEDEIIARYEEFFL